MATNKPDNQEKTQIQSGISKPEGPDSFGMPDLAFTPIKREAPAPKKQPEQKVAPEVTKQPVSSTPGEPINKRSNYGIWIFSSLIIILFTVFGVYIFIIKGATMDNWFSVLQGKETKAESESVSPGMLDDTTNVINEEELMVTPPEVLPDGSSTAKANAESPRFYIIVGGFGVVDNAKKYREQLVAEGYPAAKIIEPQGNNPLTKVSVEDYPTLEEALKRREEVKQKFDLSIWVYKY
jgi:cell division septation protein DedD